MNLNLIMERIKSSSISSQDNKNFNLPINKSITELIETASNTENLAKTDPTWMPCL